MSPRLVRRLGVLGFLATFIALALLPFLGTDFGKGAVRWYSLGFAAFQPSEFLKPGFVIVVAWALSAAQEINGPPGRRWSLVLTVFVVLLTKSRSNLVTSVLRCPKRSMALWPKLPKMLKQVTRSCWHRPAHRSINFRISRRAETPLQMLSRH